MLKKISVDQLRLGMYLKEFCGSWMEHPFWRSGFVIRASKDLAAIRTSSIKEVWIDCSKGLDIAPGENAVTDIESAERAEATLHAVTHEKRDIAPASIAVEIERAAKICDQSKGAVVAMFEEARMGKAIDVGGANQLVEDIIDSVSRNPEALISLVRLKSIDDYTYMHSVAVCAMMVALAKQLQLDPIQVHLAGLAGLMHDLGKALIDTSILNKPGRLTEEEFDLVKQHPERGHALLLTGDNVAPEILDVCLNHHEKTDGSGYPRGLKGEEISLFAKMGAVCDVYDAITSNRAYKPGWDPAESLRRMAEWVNGHFDTKVFHAFVKSIGIYPTGSLVRLDSDQLGVVIEQSGKSLTKPRVKVFYSLIDKVRIQPTIVDLSLPDAVIKIVSREDPALWNFKDLNFLWLGMKS